MNKIKKLIKILIQITFSSAVTIREFFRLRKEIKLGFLVEEFFHEDLRGFGGFGMLVKYITDYFNPKGRFFKAAVLMTFPLDIERAELRNYHNADVILKPKSPKNYVVSYLDYSRLVYHSGVNYFISVDYYGSYDYALDAFPCMPLLIWHQDPRDEVEWAQISTVALEMKFLSKIRPFDYKRFIEHQRISIHKALTYSRRCGLPIYFVSQANVLNDIGERLYDIKNTHPTFLPNPVQSIEVHQQNFSEKPSFLFLGRLDPIKRPWIYFEIAKRFKDYTFYVAGSPHYDEMNAVIAKYRDVPNLKIMGRVVGEEKTRILSSMWAMINTSIHEALPVSFLEAFMYGKPVISCRNPDDLVSRYGFYTGEILGEGTDEESLVKFDAAINKLVSKDYDKAAVGVAARQYVTETHTFENYEKILRSVLKGPVYKNVG